MGMPEAWPWLLTDVGGPSPLQVGELMRQLTEHAPENGPESTASEQHISRVSAEPHWNSSATLRTSETPSISSMTTVRTKKRDSPWKSCAMLPGDSTSFPVLLFLLTSYLRMSFNKPHLHFTLSHPEILFRGETKDPVSEDEGNSTGCRWQCGTVPLLLTTCDVEHLAFLIYLFPNDDI